MKVKLPKEAVEILEQMFRTQQPLDTESAKTLSELVMGMPNFCRLCGSEEWTFQRPAKTAEVVTLFSDLMGLEEPPLLLQQVG